jgi:uncharacterized lipoprotein YbaY
MVTGVIALPDRTPLPAGTVVQVALLNMSDPRVPGVPVVEQEFPVFDPNEPPLFTLRFDPATIDPTREYVVRAKVLIDAKVRFESRNDVAVLTRGRPPHAIIPVQPAN